MELLHPGRSPYLLLGQTQLWASGGDAEMEWAWEHRIHAPNLAERRAGLEGKPRPRIARSPRSRVSALAPNSSTSPGLRESRRCIAFPLPARGITCAPRKARSCPAAAPGSSSPTGTVDAPAASALKPCVAAQVPSPRLFRGVDQKENGRLISGHCARREV